MENSYIYLCSDPKPKYQRKFKFKISLPLLLFWVSSKGFSAKEDTTLDVVVASAVFSSITGFSHFVLFLLSFITFSRISCPILHVVVVMGWTGFFGETMRWTFSAKFIKDKFKSNNQSQTKIYNWFSGIFRDFHGRFSMKTRGFSGKYSKCFLKKITLHRSPNFEKLCGYEL